MPHASSKSLHLHLPQRVLICLDSSILCVERHFIATVLWRILIIIAFNEVTKCFTVKKNNAKQTELWNQGGNKQWGNKEVEMNWTNYEKYYSEYIWIKVYFINISAKQQHIGYAGEGYTWTMWIAVVWTRKDKSIEFFFFFFFLKSKNWRWFPFGLSWRERDQTKKKVKSWILHKFRLQKTG